MRLFFTLFVLSTISLSVVAQVPDNYFQQEVNTTIQVTLDDQNHTLTGTIEIEYINHSPDDLPLIYLHLWANAYKNRPTAFAHVPSQWQGASDHTPSSLVRSLSILGLQTQQTQAALAATLLARDID